MANRKLNTFGKRIVWLRDAAGLSLREMSLLLTGDPDAGRRHYGMIERGTRTNITVTLARTIADLFGVSLDWLIKGIGELPNAAAVQARVGRAREGAARALKRTGTDG